MTWWEIVVLVILAAGWLYVSTRPTRWQVRTAQIHTQGLAQLLADGWEPFAAMPHDDRDVVFLRRRSFAEPRPMPPDDAARFEERRGAW